MNRSTLQWSIIGLTVATALIHFVLAVIQLSQGMMGGVMFVLNGAGYLALMAVYLKWVNLPFLKGREALVLYGYLGFILVTIIGYFAVNGGASFANPLGVADKVIEVLLMAALWMHARTR